MNDHITVSIGPNTNDDSYHWRVERNGCRCGHGEAIDAIKAFEDALACYRSYYGPVTSSN